jgi:hypothetical protein
MSRSIIPKGGNDRVYTPLSLTRDIVSYFNPYGVVMEPCKGSGNFVKSLEEKAQESKQIHVIDWCEIDEGIDFLEYDKKVNWIITNPPFSQFRVFLQKSLAVSDNVVFLSLVNAFFFKARFRDIKEAGFGFKEIIFIDTPPPPWPQFGIQMGVVHLQKNFTGDTKFTHGFG